MNAEGDPYVSGMTNDAEPERRRSGRFSWLPPLRHVEGGVPLECPLVDGCIGDDCTDLGTHSPWYPGFSADRDPLRWNRTAHYVGAWDHVSGPSRPRFHLSCA